MKTLYFVAVIALSVGLGASASAQVPALSVVPLVEKTVENLPADPLYWRLESCASRDRAQAAAGPWSLVTEAGGTVWLVTLGASGGAAACGETVTEIGPISRVAATRYLLRVNRASGPPGSVTPVHSHPGSEAVYVIAGEHSIRGPHGVSRTVVGQASPDHGVGMVMQVSSSGSTDLLALVLFVVDADKPFSTPATLP